MKKTNFFKLFLVGAVALTLGFSSCQDTVSQKDFEAVCKEVDLLQTDVDQLKKDLAALGTAVKDVKSDPSDPYKLNVTYTNGNSAVITIPEGEEGPGGTSFITINEAGNWVIGGVDTGAKASELAPRINTTTDANHFWEFPVVGADNKITWVAGPKAIAAAYAVETATEWILYLPTAGHDKLQAIPLSKGGTVGGLGKIDILGWVEGYAPTNNIATNWDGNVAPNTQGTSPLYSLSKETFVVYYNWIERFEQEGNGASFSYGVDTDLPYWLAGANNVTASNTAPFTPNANWLWWNPDQITEGTQLSTSTPAWDFKAKAAAYVWHQNTTPAEDFGMYDVKPKSVVNIMDSQDKGLIVQVHPLTVPFDKMSGLTLQDSKGSVLPIDLKAPVLISGLLTRADAGNSALYFVEGKNLPLGDFPTRESYAAKFKANALYSLVTSDGIRSEYTPFTFVPTYVASFEAQVKTVDAKPIQTATSTVDPSFYVTKDVWNKVTFDKEDRVNPANTAATRATIKHADEINPLYDGTISGAFESDYFDPRYPVSNGYLHHEGGAFVEGDHISTNSVVDFYTKVGSNEQDENYIKNVFGLQWRNNNTEFMVTKLPDGLTLVTFNMNVYKLGIDGKIYLETIKIHPVRETKVTEYTVPYLVQDEFPDINSANRNYSDYLSTPIDINLEDMFAVLRTIPDVSEENMADRWMDDLYGARSYKIMSIKVGNSDRTARFWTNAAPDAQVTGATVPVMPNGNDVFTILEQPQVGKTAFVGLKGDGSKITGSNWYDARTLRIYPNYAYETTGGDVASFEIGKEHVALVNFYDKDNNVLSTIQINITPSIPELTELFKKEPQYWVDVNATDPVLNAYYKVPFNPWYSWKFYGSDYGAANAWITPANTIGNVANTYLTGLGYADADDMVYNSTFYNVYNPGGTTDMTHTAAKPLDGGYTKVGSREDKPDAKQWVDFTQLALRTPNAAFEGKTYKDYIVAPTGTNVVNATNGAHAGFTANTFVQLFNQTNLNVGQGTDYALTATGLANGTYASDLTGIEFGATGNAYEDAIPMKWELGPYIHYYKYDNAAIEKENFQIKVMSALDKGSVVATGNPMESKGSVHSELTREHIAMKDYAGNPRDIFKEFVTGAGITDPDYAGYAYNYIHKVIFSRPPSVSVYDILDGNLLEANNGAEAIAPVKDDPATAGVNEAKASYLPLLTSSITQPVTTTIHVQIYDRFGRVLDQDVDFVIQNNVAD